MNSRRKQTILRILALVFVIAISVAVFIYRDRAEQLAEYGYAGIFALMILANATIILPAPGVAVVYAMGAVFHPLWVGVAAGSGSVIGEMSAYLAGYGGRAVVEQADLYGKLISWMQAHNRLTYLAIFILATIPNPFFDLAGIAAGTLRISIPAFFILTWLGKLIKMTIFAYAGYYSLEIFNR